MSVSVPVEKIAEDDIPIFKICNRINNTFVLSYYNYFRYQLNEVYKLENELLVCFNDYWYTYEVNEGFHSYNEDCSIRRRFGVLTIRDYSGRLLDTCNPHCVKVHGYIPKGSVYYINERGEYVSDKICLTEIKEL